MRWCSTTGRTRRSRSRSFERPISRSRHCGLWRCTPPRRGAGTPRPTGCARRATGCSPSSSDATASAPSAALPRPPPRPAAGPTSRAGHSDRRCGWGCATRPRSPAGAAAASGRRSWSRCRSWLGAAPSTLSSRPCASSPAASTSRSRRWRRTGRELGDRRAEFRTLTERIYCLGDLVHPSAMFGMLVALIDSLGAERALQRELDDPVLRVRTAAQERAAGGAHRRPPLRPPGRLHRPLRSRAARLGRRLRRGEPPYRRGADEPAGVAGGQGPGDLAVRTTRDRVPRRRRGGRGAPAPPRRARPRSATTSSS